MRHPFNRSTAASRSSFAVAATVLSGALAISGATAQAAIAPAGDAIDITSLTGTGTSALHWAGFYSCTGTTAADLWYQASDLTSGGTDYKAGEIAEPCPATSKPVSGTIPGPTDPWRQDASIDWQLANPLEQAYTDMSVVLGNDVRMIVDSISVTDGSVHVDGTFSCADGNSRAIIRISASEGLLSLGGIGSAEKNLTCPATAGTAATYSVQVAPPAGSQFQPTSPVQYTASLYIGGIHGASVSGVSDPS